MDQNYLTELKCRSVAKEVPLLLWISKVNYLSHKARLLAKGSRIFLEKLKVSLASLQIPYLRNLKNQYRVQKSPIPVVILTQMSSFPKDPFSHNEE